MAIEVQFFSLVPPFARVKTEVFADEKAALAAVKAYAEPQGYTNVRLVEGDDPCEGFRYTGRTPGGRSGRNIAFGDWIEG
jgi:hypothetical protein